jgi:hypothetical protein
MASSRRFYAGLRPWLAAAAAYCLLIQSLFAGVALGHMAANAGAAEHTFVICSDGGTANGSGKPDASPAHRSACVLCAATPVVAALPDAAAPVARLQMSGTALPTPATAVVAPSFRHSPRQSQGPPQIA